MPEWIDRVPYNSGTVDLYAPETAGVYRLIYKSNDDYYVFYVGQSDNLKERLKDHLSPGEPNECIKNHLKNHDCFFRYIEIGTQSERDRIEREEIDHWKPSCNAVSG